MSRPPHPRDRTAARPTRAPVKKTLDRVLSKAGAGSRTEAREWAAAGRIRVNGRPVDSVDVWIDPARDKVTLDGRPLRTETPRYILLYKPRGYVTTYKDPAGRPTVYDLLTGVGQFVGTVGRLDLETSGLLLLTNDTRLADALMSPAHHVPKTYLVKAVSLLEDAALERLRTGVELDGEMTRPAEVTRLRDQGKRTFLEITITEGRNRQVRRMLEAVGSGVMKLVRTRLGPLEIGPMTIGSFRDLAPDEVRALYRAAGIDRAGPMGPETF